MSDEPIVLESLKAKRKYHFIRRQFRTTIGAYLWMIPIGAEREAYKEAYRYLGYDLSQKIVVERFFCRSGFSEVISPLKENGRRI